MFRRSTVRYGKTPKPETPYQRAGQVWDERIGSARVQAKNWRLAFFGALALGDYARNNDPFSKVGKAQVSVEVASVIRASDDSFRVEWVERRYVDDALASTERWSAILTIVVQTPIDADRLKKNPLGVYVHALNWSKELG